MWFVFLCVPEVGEVGGANAARVELPAARVWVGAPERLRRKVAVVVVRQVEHEEERAEPHEGKQQILLASLERDMRRERTPRAQNKATAEAVFSSCFL